MRRSPPACDFVKMSKGQALRALVNERLAAAAEDIFVLFERTMAEYEEELCRSREENQRKQRLLDQVLSPTIDLVRENFHIPSSSPGPGLDPETTESPRVQEKPQEQSIKQEEEQLPVCVSESSAVRVKTEESSLLRHTEQTQGEDFSPEPQFHSEPEGLTELGPDSDSDDCVPSSSAAARRFIQRQMKTKADHYDQIQTRDRILELFSQNISAPESAVHDDDPDGGERATGRRVHMFQRHIRAHAAKRPYVCAFCKKAFTFKAHLDLHRRTHTREKPFCCPVCKKRFSQKCNLGRHMRTHTGEKPFTCSVCNRPFSDKSNLNSHMRTHEAPPRAPGLQYVSLIPSADWSRPFSLSAVENRHRCSVCHKTFSLKAHLDSHRRTHTGEKPFCCPICKKRFSQNGNLRRHVRIHTGEKPFSCSVCNKAFADKSNLNTHMRTHAAPWTASHLADVAVISIKTE